MGSFSKNMALLALGFWIGCAYLFAGVIAPMLFDQSIEGPLGGLNRDVAGSIVTAILPRIYKLTYVCVGIAVLFLFMACFSEAKGAKGPRRALILCILLLGLNAANHLWILDKVHHIKLAMVNPDGTKSSTLKKEFDQWHTISTWTYGAAGICGIIAAACLLPAAVPAKSSGGKSKSGKK
jgi:hypothetical protein